MLIVSSASRLVGYQISPYKGCIELDLAFYKVLSACKKKCPSIFEKKIHLEITRNVDVPSPDTDYVA